MNKVIPTKTFLFLAIRQKKWEEAMKVAKELSLPGFVLPAIRLAAKGDAKAGLLLKMWANIKWERLR